MTNDAIRAEQARISDLRQTYWAREAAGLVVRPGRWERLGAAQHAVDLAYEINAYHPCLSVAEQVERVPEQYREHVRALVGA